MTEESKRSLITTRGLFRQVNQTEIVCDLDLWQWISVCTTYTHRKAHTSWWKMHAHTHVAFTHTWSHAYAEPSLHLFVLQSSYTNAFTNSCISVHANVHSRAEHARWSMIAEAQWKAASHFDKPMCKNVLNTWNKLCNYLDVAKNEGVRSTLYSTLA